MPAYKTRTRRRTLRRLALPVAAFGTAALAAPTAHGNAPRVDGRERNVIHRINQIRADHGLRALDLTPGLSRAADRHSRWQARTRTLSHQLPGEADLGARLRGAADGKPVSEVIFWGDGGIRSARIVRAWMSSPDHRSALLSGSFSRAGIGIRTGRGGLYATVDLAG